MSGISIRRRLVTDTVGNINSPAGYIFSLTDDMANTWNIQFDDYGVILHANTL